MGCPLRVFISHKVKEQGAAAEQFVKKLRLYGDKSKLKIFLSPEIAAGSNWNDKIHKQLRDSDILILLYLNPSAETDWCLYETGFFAAAAEDNPERQLICVVPKDQTAPGPLEKWQHIELTKEGIKKLLKAIFNAQDCAVKPELFGEELSKELNELINKVLEALGPGEVVRPLSHWVKITIPEPEEDMGFDKKELIKTLLKGELPEGTTISGDTEAFRQLGIDSKEEIPFTEIQDHMGFGLAIPFFQPILTNAMAGILENKAGPFTLPSVRVMKSGPARSLVFNNLREMPNGEMIFEFVVAELPSTATYGIEDSFSTLYHLLAVALHFRRRVINQHKATLDNKTYDDDGSQKYQDSVRQLLGQIGFDIDGVLLDSMNRGILSRGQILKVFEEDSEDQKTIAAIIGIEGGRWKEAIGTFKTAVAECDIRKAVEAMGRMEDMNNTIIKITSLRMATLVEDI